MGIVPWNGRQGGTGCLMSHVLDSFAWAVTQYLTLVLIQKLEVLLIHNQPHCVPMVAFQTIYGYDLAGDNTCRVILKRRLAFHLNLQSQSCIRW